MRKFLIAIDQGTTSTRVILFDTKGNIQFKSQFELKQYFPKNGWVEHNPNEIWLTTLKALKKVIKIFIHGFLHLIGYDHKKNKDFKKMSNEETKIFNLVESKFEKVI